MSKERNMTPAEIQKMRKQLEAQLKKMNLDKTAKAKPTVKATPTPKKTFTATVKTEKQQNINTRTGTGNMANKAKPAPRTPSKQMGSVGSKWEPMKKDKKK